jgi:hypothetical protein
MTPLLVSHHRSAPAAVFCGICGGQFGMLDALTLVAHQQVHIDRGDAVEIEKDQGVGVTPQRVVVLALDEAEWLERGWSRACR